MRNRFLLCVLFFALGNAGPMLAQVELKPGPHLLIDDFLIASSSNVIRRPVTLKREALSEAPVITAAKHHPFQPFFTVLRDPATGTFRIWYGMSTDELSTMRSRIGYTESADGIHWTNAPRVLDIGPIQFGVSIIDEGPQFRNRDERYKLGWYFERGLKTATSPDGFNWKPRPDFAVEHGHDINGIFWDPIREQYGAILSFYIPGETWTGTRRITKQSVSKDFVKWADPWPVVTPDAKDEGETQFYAMDGFLARGNVMVGMVKVLRDDLKADNPPEPPEAYGLGYTTVAWTRDGREWTRERTPFLDRSARKGDWDHAHAWIDEQVPVGDEVYLYYGGYKSGHKVNRFQERQIGLIKMKRDRYVAREAASEGTLRTKPLLLSGSKLFVNADASRGELRVRILSADGKPIKGFAEADCNAVRSDGVKTEVTWKRSLKKLPKKPVILEFLLKNASLFAFELE